MSEQPPERRFRSGREFEAVAFPPVPEARSAYGEVPPRQMGERLASEQIEELSRAFLGQHQDRP
jgi:hypothetical protein